MATETLTRARYLWTADGRPAGDESFELAQGERGAAARVERARFSAAARLDPAWRLESLEASARGGGRERSARYRWDEDAWVGRLSGTPPAEVALPMTSELEATCETAFFDFVFLKRAALAPLSQRRIELLRVRLDTLETEQGHQIVERLADARLEGDGAAPTAQVFRVTDELGRQDLIWTREDGVCLRRAAADGSQERYRLAP